MPVHHLPVIMAKVSHEQRKEKGEKAGLGREEKGLCISEWTRPSALWAAVTISQQGGGRGDRLHSSKALRICLRCRGPQFDSWVRKIPWRKDRPPTPAFLGFPGGSAGKESACNAGDLG